MQDADIKRHSGYKKGKAGEPDSAIQLITDLALPFLMALRSELPADCIFVSPYAQEAAGDNALPLMLSLMCAELFKGTSEIDIVQQERVFHTGADPMERLISRPSFEGRVQPGAQYVLVDDVTSMGGTLAELNNFIRIHGGQVFGTLVLVNAGRTKDFVANKKILRLLEDRHHDYIQQIFGIHTPALTANEANYLIGFRTLDEIRNRCIKAEEETAQRLLSKGYQRAHR